MAEAPAPAPPAEPAAPPQPVAWQFFTPRGIAAFAPATFGRLFIFQVLVALICGGAIVWFLYHAWCPAIRESIRNLAGEGAIRADVLEVPGFSMQRLVTNRFLTLAMDLETERRHTYSADVFVVLRRAHIEVCSLVGCAMLKYPVREAPFTRLELEADWGAWEPFLLGIAGAAAAFAVLFSWWLLATACFLFVRTLAFFSDRALTLGGSWRLCGAALLAGAMLLALGMVGYGTGVIDLITLALVAALHFVVPWILIVFATLALPPVSAKSPSNPFQSTASSAGENLFNAPPQS